LKDMIIAREKRVEKRCRSIRKSSFVLEDLNNYLFKKTHKKIGSGFTIQETCTLIYAIGCESDLPINDRGTSGSNATGVLIFPPDNFILRNPWVGCA